MYPFPSRRTLRSAAAALLGLAAVVSFPFAAFGQVSVLTQNNDNARTGANTQETVLNPGSVTAARFGKLFTRTLDADVNGQVLYVPHLTVGGTTRNVLIASTSNNNNGSLSSVYAFDADDPNLSTPLWRHVLPTSAQWTTETPVIDAAAGIVYLLTKTANDSGETDLRALNLTTGNELPGSPAAIAGSVSGNGDGSANGVVSFDTTHADDRPALLLANGTVYVSFAHNSDTFPYHGWIFGYHYDGAQFTQTATFCTTPHGGEGGIWMSGKGLTADADGNIYCTVGNGTFTANTGGDGYGMCVLKLTPDLSVADWFAPFDESGLSNSDLDLGNCGVTLIPGTNRLFTGATKFGAGFLLDSSNLGGFTQNGPDAVVQRLNGLTPNDSVGQNAIVWDTGGVKYVYLWAKGAELEQFRYDPAVGTFSPTGFYKTTSGMTTGGSLTVTANGSGGGILWAIGYDHVVRAFDATDVTKPVLWTSAGNATRDGIAGVGHFQFPTVANGKVYVPTGGNHTIAVYGLLPPTTTAPAHLLWDNANGPVALWSQDPATGSFTVNTYFAGAGWSGQAIADGPDHRTRLLWNNSDGRAMLWAVDSAGSFTTLGVYGPYTDAPVGPNSLWTASALSVGPDNVPHILWTNPDGRVLLWNVKPDGTFTIAGVYGPYTDGAARTPWSATALSTGPDSLSHILWNNANGRVALWSVNRAGSFTVIGGYGPYIDGAAGNTWSATALATGSDNVTHLVWNNTDARVALWSVDGAGSFTVVGGYGPYTDGTPNTIWKAVALGVGSDNRVRMLWRNTDGKASLFSVNGQGGFTFYPYGPFNSTAVVGVSGAQ